MRLWNIYISSGSAVYFFLQKQRYIATYRGHRELLAPQNPEMRPNFNMRCFLWDFIHLAPASFNTQRFFGILYTWHLPVATYNGSVVKRYKRSLPVATYNGAKSRKYKDLYLPTEKSCYVATSASSLVFSQQKSRI